jgi:sacsin
MSKVWSHILFFFAHTVAGPRVHAKIVHSADDSGATAIEFILDPIHHPTDPLLHPGGGLAEFQGPALIAYNNRTFSERDFRSLSKIGDSEKLHDLNSTGRFGRGFNSVFIPRFSAGN